MCGLRKHLASDCSHYRIQRANHMAEYVLLREKGLGCLTYSAGQSLAMSCLQGKVVPHPSRLRERQLPSARDSFLEKVVGRNLSQATPAVAERGGIREATDSHIGKVITCNSNNNDSDVKNRKELQCFIYVMPRFECFVAIDSFNPHNTHVWVGSIIISILQVRKL